MMVYSYFNFLQDFIEQYQVLSIVLLLAFILGAAYYLKKTFPKIFDEKKEELKSQDELDKENLEALIKTQKIEEVIEEKEEDENPYFFNDKVKKEDNKD